MKKQNRIKSKQPRGRRFWCGKCDRNMIQAGSRCEVCGCVDGKARDKKPSPID